MAAGIVIREDVNVANSTSEERPVNRETYAMKSLGHKRAFILTVPSALLVALLAGCPNQSIPGDVNENNNVSPNEQSVLGSENENDNESPEDAWSVSEKKAILEVAYGQDGNSPQFASLHLTSSYFRLNYGPGSGWGTSVVLLPSLWSRGELFQGAPVEIDWEVDDGDLIIRFAGEIGTLAVQGSVRISPPAESSIRAAVTVEVTGDAELDNRPGEAFKPVFLSSMHISDNQWDAESLIAASKAHTLLQEGWIIDPLDVSTTLELVGGSSQWKTNAPTIRLEFDRPFEVTGWVTPSDDPNDDNVGAWPSSATLLRSWDYVIVCEKP